VTLNHEIDIGQFMSMDINAGS